MALDAGTQARLRRGASAFPSIILTLARCGLVPDAATAALYAGDDEEAGRVMLSRPHGAHGQELIDLVKSAWYHGAPNAAVAAWLGTDWHDDAGLWRVVHSLIERCNVGAVKTLLSEGYTTPRSRQMAIREAAEHLGSGFRPAALAWFHDGLPEVAEAIRKAPARGAQPRKRGP